MSERVCESGFRFLLIYEQKSETYMIIKLIVVTELCVPPVSLGIPAGFACVPRGGGETGLERLSLLAQFPHNVSLPPPPPPHWWVASLLSPVS